MTKSYLGETKVIDIEGEKITLRTYTYAVQKQISEFVTKEQIQESLDLFLRSTVTDWTLTDDANVKLPITTAVLDTLSGSFINKILKEATAFNNLEAAEIKNLSGR